MHAATIPAFAAFAATVAGQFTEITIPAGQSVNTTFTVSYDISVTATIPGEIEPGTSSAISLTSEPLTPMTPRPLQTMTVVCMDYDQPCGCPEGVDFCVPLYPDVTASVNNTDWGNSSHVFCTPICWDQCEQPQTWGCGSGGCHTEINPVCTDTPYAPECVPQCVPDVPVCEPQPCPPEAPECVPVCIPMPQPEGPMDTPVCPQPTLAPVSGPVVPCDDVTCSTTCWTKVTHNPTPALPATPQTPPPVLPVTEPGTVNPTATLTIQTIGTAGAPRSFGMRESLVGLAGVSALMVLFA